MHRRNFIKLGAWGAILSGSGLAACAFSGNKELESTDPDILVAGGTPAGIMAAIAAARMGARVTLAEYHRHLGGMSASGLGKSDIENKEAIAGLFLEFTQRVLKYYTGKYGEGSENVALCKEGYYYEPSVAELIFNQMIGEEKNIRVLPGHQLRKVEMDGDRITGAVFTDRAKGEDVTVRANVFVDATYEGDLFALAGADYRLGRESKEAFGEAHAGRIFFDYNDKVFLEGSTGEGDDRLPAYTYRLCMTDDPENSYVLTEPPAGYDRKNYLGYFDDLKEGRLSAPKVFKEGHGYYSEHFDTMVRIFSFTEIPNRKYDVNINPRPLGFPFVGENYDYPEAGWEEREKISERHRQLTLGMIYFVQNDPEVPEAHRELARRYHLPLDEFTDNRHFPWQLYIREARRLKGQYTLTENDVTLQGNKQRTTVFEDSIIAGEFPIDSFPVSKEPSADRKVLEGYVGMLEIAPYQVPYRILIPEKIKGLIVPVAASTTHVAFSTVRMEPLWMGIGQVAGVAARLSVENKTEVGQLPVHLLQRNLIESGQIITYFEDMDPGDEAFRAVQFWGTKGFFGSYLAAARESLTAGEAGRWLTIACGQMGLQGTPALPGTPPQEEGAVSVAAFSSVLHSLGARAGLWQESASVETSLANAGIGPGEWLYGSRQDGSPVLRGEACKALYVLFFLLAQKQKIQS